MPELQPFRGIRYAATGDLADLVCPPYDVISPDEQRALHERHPHNAVRVELPFWRTPDEDEMARYRRAARCFEQWLDARVLERDAAECLYVYRQDFARDDGTRHRVAGVVGALKLEPFGAGSRVLPHERTMPGPVEDRLALLRACPVNISPIYAIYRGGGAIAPFLDGLEARPPDARFVDHDILHRMWIIRAPAEVEMLATAIGAGSLVIADGHHRYETALAYHAERGGGPGDHDSVMCFCVDADSEHLVVLPYHRGITDGAGARGTQELLRRRFGATYVDRNDPQRALGGSDADHPFVFVLPGATLLVGIADEAVAAVVGERAPAWRQLDVVALHEAVLPEVFPEGIDQLRFSKDWREIVRLVDAGEISAGVLLRPLRAGQVVDVAGSGERMPQKASYFWPKAVTGLVFRSLA